MKQQNALTSAMMVSRDHLLTPQKTRGNNDEDD